MCYICKKKKNKLTYAVICYLDYILEYELARLQKIKSQVPPTYFSFVD